jgi:pimeloyl-ACP methyl ester carboxylesterase
MCHGFTSDKSSGGRFDRFANSFHQLGYSVLAFDFSGCGESDDDRLTIAKWVDDLHSAISFLKSKGYTNIALYGNSLGSRVCLQCYTAEISTMVLTGASTGPIKYNWDEYFTKEQMQELKEKGYITEHRRQRTVIIDKQMLLDFELVNQEELLKNVHCPVLIIHGNADEEERRLCEITKQGMQWLSKDSKLEIIDGASHGFMDHLDIVEKLVTDWFLKYFAL